MGFNNDKKKKLADLLAKLKAAIAGKGTSTPIAPSTSATPAPHPTEPARGVVVVESDYEETCTGLVFKRQRVGETVAPSTSASGGTPTFMDHPPSASSPLPLVVYEGGGESASEAQEMPSTSPLPMLLQRIFSRFQDKEVVEGLSGNFLQDRMVDSLGDFLIASNLALNRPKRPRTSRLGWQSSRKNCPPRPRSSPTARLPCTWSWQAFANLRRTPRRPFMTRAKRWFN